MKNLVLMAPFQPLEKLGNFGLDGLWVNVKRPFEACGVQVQGVEGVLFETEDSKRPSYCTEYAGFNIANYDERTSDTNNDGVSDIVDALLTAQYFVGLNPAAWQD